MSDPLKPEGAGSPEHYTDDSADGPAHYTDRTADPLADALDEISTCLRNAVTPPAGATAAAMQAQHDQLLALRDVYAPAMLAAVSGALALPAKWEQDMAVLGAQASSAERRGYGGTACRLRGLADAREECVRELRSAVSRALLGEETAGG